MALQPFLFYPNWSWYANGIFCDIQFQTHNSKVGQARAFETILIWTLFLCFNPDIYSAYSLRLLCKMGSREIMHIILLIKECSKLFILLHNLIIRKGCSKRCITLYFLYPGDFLISSCKLVAIIWHNINLCY